MRHDEHGHALVRKVLHDGEHLARDVSERVVFMHEGVILEQGSPEAIFGDPQHQQTKDFLARFRNT